MVEAPSRKFAARKCESLGKVAASGLRSSTALLPVLGAVAATALLLAPQHAHAQSIGQGGTGGGGGGAGGLNNPIVRGNGLVGQPGTAPGAGGGGGGSGWNGGAGGAGEGGAAGGAGGTGFQDFGAYRAGSNGADATVPGGGGGGGGAAGAISVYQGGGNWFVAPFTGRTGGNGGAGLGTGSGGGGGAGGFARLDYTTANTTQTLNNSFYGGVGGTGGAGGITGNGGNGGDGGFGIILTSLAAGSPTTFVLSTATVGGNVVVVAGGTGGAGGSGVISGAGGAGGAGLFQSGGTITNSGIIAGGNGGVGSVAGAGGIGLIGENITLTNNRSISGGLAGGNGPRAFSLSLSGTNTINALGTLVGGVNIASGTTTLGSGAADPNFESLSGAGNLQVTAGTLRIGNAGAAATVFSGAISGSSGLIKYGNSTQTLAGVNTYGGLTQVNEGELVLAAGGVIAGAVSNNAAFTNGGTINGSGTIATNARVQNLAGGSWNGTIKNSGSLTNAGTVTGLVENDGSFISTGLISGPLQNRAAGTAQLQGAVNGNIYNQSLLTLTGITTGIDAFTQTETGTFELGGFNTTIGSLEGLGLVKLGSAGLTVGGNNTSTQFGGVITGTGTGLGNALTKVGTGTLTLAGVNTFTGTTGVSGGELLITGELNTVVINDATLRNDGTIRRSIQNNSGAIFINNGTVAGDVVLNLNGATMTNTGTVRDLTNHGTLTSTGSIRLLDNFGAASISGALNGDVYNAGTITLTGTTTGIGTVYQEATGLLDLAGFDTTIGSLQEAGQVNLGAAVLTTGGDNESTTFSGVISGSGGLDKVGTGTFTLSGANTFTGLTSISAGTLSVTGELAGPVSNSTALFNSGRIRGQVDNGAGATFTNTGTVDGLVANNNVLVSRGSLRGGLTQVAGASALVSGTLNGAVTNRGSITVNGNLASNSATEVLGDGQLVLLSGATWSGATLITNRSTNAAGLVIAGTLQASTSLDNQLGATAVVSTNGTVTVGSVSNKGAFTNDGTVSSTLGPSYNGGQLTNNGTWTGGILASGGRTTNNGTWNGGFEAQSSAYVINNATWLIAGATAKVDGATFENNSLLTGLGVDVSGAGLLANRAGATISLDAGQALSASGLGKVSNAGSVNGAGIAGLNGTIENLADSAWNGLLTALEGGVITNAGAINGGVDNSGSFTSIGSVTGTLHNRAGGTALIEAVMNGSIDNDGLTTLTGTTTGIDALTQTATGTFDLGGFDTTIGSLAGAGQMILGSAALTLGGNNASTTFSGAITGTGVRPALTKVGIGTLTLSGVNTYSGSTLVNSGTLVLATDGQIAGDVDVASNFTNNGRVLGMVSNSGTLVSTGMLLRGLTQSAGASALLSGSLTGAISNRGFITVNGNLSSDDNLLEIVDNGRVVVQSGATWKGVDEIANRSTNAAGLVIDGALQVTSSVQIGAGSSAYVGSGGMLTAGNGVVSAGLVANNGTLNGDLRATDGQTINNGTWNGSFALTTDSATVNKGTWNSNRAPFSIISSTFENLGLLAGSGGNVGEGGELINRVGATISLDAGAALVAADTSSGITNAGAINGDVDNSGSLASTGSITGMLRNRVTGTALLEGAMNGNVVNDGHVSLTGTTTGIDALTQAATGMFDLGGFNTTIGSLAGTGQLNLGAAAITLGSNDSSTTFSGVISGSGTLSKVGRGTLVLTGANTYTGLTTVLAGELDVRGQLTGPVSNSATLLNSGAIRGAVQNDAGAVLANSGAIGGAVFNGGRLVSNGSLLAGLIQFSGSNAVLSGTLKGGPIANAGLLEVNSDLSSSGIAEVFGDGQAIVQSGATWSGLDSLYNRSTNRAGLQVDGTLRIGGALETDAGTMTVVGPGGTLTAGSIRNGGVFTNNGTVTTGANGAYNGGVIASVGTINGSVDNSGSFTSTGSITGMLRNRASGTAVLEGVLNGSVWNDGLISLTGSTTGIDVFFQSETGTFNLAGFNTSVGILAGTGQVNLGSATLTTGGKDISSGFSGVISGSGGLTKVGTDILALSGANTYTGQTSVLAGTLQVTGELGGSVLNDAALRNFGIIRGQVDNASGATADNFGTIEGGVVNKGTLVSVGWINTGLENSGSARIGWAVNGFVYNSGTIVLADYTNGIDAFTQTATGTFDLGGFNTAIGSLAGEGQVNLGAATLYTGGNNSSQRFGGVISGSGILLKTGTGAFTLTGANSYTGGTVVRAGRLVGNTGSLQGSILVEAPGVLEFAQGSAGTYAGSLFGAGRLDKTGAGLLTLNGNSASFTGGTFVTGGELRVTGDLRRSVVTVQNSAILSGTGVIGGLVAQSGSTIAPGTSPGVLLVNGNVSLAAGSKVQFELSATGPFDQILATGTASLAGNLAFTNLSGANAYALNSTYLLLQADGGRTGTFAQIDGFTGFGAIYRPELVYNGTQVLLRMAPNSLSNIVGTTPLTANQKSVVTRIDTAVAAGYNPQPLFNIYLLPTAQLPGAFDQLSGEVYPAAAGVGLEQERLIREAVLGRISSVSAATRADAAAGKRLGAWGQYFRGWGNGKGDGNAASVKSDRNGFITGVDAGGANDTASWRLGAFGMQVQSDVTVAARGSRAHVKQAGGGIYGAFNTGDFSVALGGYLTKVNLRASREISLPGFAEANAGKTSGTARQVFAELSYTFDLGDNQLRPFVNGTIGQIKLDALTEKGGAAALAVARQQYSTGTATAGLDGMLNLGKSLQLAGALAGRFQLGDRDPSAQIALAAAPVSAFGVNGAQFDKLALAARLDATLQLARNLDVSVGYTGVIGKTVKDHGARATVQLRF